MELVDPPQVVNSSELEKPFFRVFYKVCKSSLEKVSFILAKGVFRAKVGEVVVGNVGDSLLLKGFIFFLGLFEMGLLLQLFELKDVKLQVRLTLRSMSIVYLIIIL